MAARIGFQAWAGDKSPVKALRGQGLARGTHVPASIQDRSV